jgi:hypothetical protein
MDPACSQVRQTKAGERCVQECGYRREEGREVFVSWYGYGAAVCCGQPVHHPGGRSLSDITCYEDTHGDLEPIPGAGQPQALRLPHHGSQLQMAPEMGAYLYRVRSQVEHRAHTLDDMPELCILRKLEGEAEPVLPRHRPDTEPPGGLVAGNRAAILVVPYRFHARRRFGGKQRSEERPVEWGSVGKLQRDRVSVDAPATGGPSAT